MINDIVVFTLNGCHHCDSLKKRLNNLSIEYNEMEITSESGKKIFDKIVEETGHSLIPTVVIVDKKEGVSRVFVPDIDFHSEDEIIQVIKSYI